MTFFDRSGLERAGFTGWVPVLSARKPSAIPTSGGVYVVTREPPNPPVYRHFNPAGRFKGRDPSVPLADCIANWVPDADVMYIGKANVLQRRIDELARFAAGAPIGHWGGRLLWQLGDAEELLIAWKETPGEVPLSVEQALIRRFRAEYGKPPFANAPHLLGR